MQINKFWIDKMRILAKHNIKICEKCEETRCLVVCEKSPCIYYYNHRKTGRILTENRECCGCFYKIEQYKKVTGKIKATEFLRAIEEVEQCML